MNEKPHYYAIIPASVRYDRRIPALCNKEGYCWAENTYFANIFT
jgi:hypothetical protein